MPMEFLERAFAVVIIPPQDDDVYRVWLMKLKASGEIDFDHEHFELARTAGRDPASNYSKKLGEFIGLKVLEVR